VIRTQFIFHSLCQARRALEGKCGFQELGRHKLFKTLVSPRTHQKTISSHITAALYVGFEQTFRGEEEGTYEVDPGTTSANGGSHLGPTWLDFLAPPTVSDLYVSAVD